MASLLNKEGHANDDESSLEEKPLVSSSSLLNTESHSDHIIPTRHTGVFRLSMTGSYLAGRRKGKKGRKDGVLNSLGKFLGGNEGPAAAGGDEASVFTKSHAATDNSNQGSFEGFQSFDDEIEDDFDGPSSFHGSTLHSKQSQSSMSDISLVHEEEFGGDGTTALSLPAKIVPAGIQFEPSMLASQKSQKGGLNHSSTSLNSGTSFRKEGRRKRTMPVDSDHGRGASLASGASTLPDEQQSQEGEMELKDNDRSRRRGERQSSHRRSRSSSQKHRRSSSTGRGGGIERSKSSRSTRRSPTRSDESLKDRLPTRSKSAKRRPSPTRTTRSSKPMRHSSTSAIPPPRGLDKSSSAGGSRRGLTATKSTRDTPRRSSSQHARRTGHGDRSSLKSSNHSHDSGEDQALVERSRAQSRTRLARAKSERSQLRSKHNQGPSRGLGDRHSHHSRRRPNLSNSQHGTRSIPIDMEETSSENERPGLQRSNSLGQLAAGGRPAIRRELSSLYA